MPDPSITPTAIGAATYAIANSRGLVADLALNVSVSAPFATFDLSCQALSPGLQIKLVKGAQELNLLPDALTDASTFTNRMVITSLTVDGAQTVLTVEIRALAMPVKAERWRLLVKANAAGAHRLTQSDNDPAAPTVRLLMCDPIARFQVKGDVTQGAGEVIVKSQKAFTLEAEAGTGSAALMKVPTVPTPAVRYRWISSGSVSVPGLPACGDSRTLSLSSPKVMSPQTVKLGLDVWLEGECPATVGWLNSSAQTLLRVEPLAGEFELEKEALISPDEMVLSESRGYYLLDGKHGLIALWPAAEPQTEDSVTPTIFGSRLDLNNPAGKFDTPRMITVLGQRQPPHSVLLPNGEILVAYNQFFPNTISYKQAAFADLPSAAEHNFTDDIFAPAMRDPRVYVSGDLAVFFFFLTSTKTYSYRRYRYTDHTWVDQTGRDVLAPLPVPGGIQNLTASADQGENIWIIISVVAQASSELRVQKLIPATGVMAFGSVFGAPGGQPLVTNPFVLSTSANEVWILGASSAGLQFVRHIGDTPQTMVPESIPNTGAGDANPVAVVDSKGGIWLFWERSVATSPTKLNFVMRRHPVTGAWGQPQQLKDVNLVHSAIITPDDTIWIFYLKSESSLTKQAYRKITTVL